MKRLIGLALLVVLSGCGQGSEPADAPSAPGADAHAALPEGDPWAGRWDGPEGLFLQIEPQGEGEYRLILKDNLDDQAEYTAEITATGLSFSRKGRLVIIHKGAGPETGFKWLADKTDCLILVDGQEGYCRD